MALVPFDDRDGLIWMDGEFVQWREAKVHVLTHALHYASCVFEGVRMYDGEIFKLTDHAERLFRSAEILDFQIPFTVAADRRGLQADGGPQRPDQLLHPPARLARARADGRSRPSRPRPTWPWHLGVGRATSIPSRRGRASA